MSQNEMPAEVAKSICREQARGCFGPVHPNMARRIMAAIGDDPEFERELHDLRKLYVKKYQF